MKSVIGFENYGKDFFANEKNWFSSTTQQKTGKNGLLCLKCSPIFIFFTSGMESSRQKTLYFWNNVSKRSQTDTEMGQAKIVLKSSTFFNCLNFKMFHLILKSTNGTCSLSQKYYIHNMNFISLLLLMMNLASNLSRFYEMYRSWLLRKVTRNKLLLFLESHCLLSAN